MGLKRFLMREEGAVAIEFVLIAPLLLTLLFGTIVVGYYMGLSHSVHQLAASAARASVPGLDAEERRDLAEAYLSNAGQHYPLLVPSAVTPTVTMEDAPGMTVQVVYALDGGILDIANGFLKLGIEDIRGQAYVAY
ncbi:TadE/TadG family type IV pilus assembly protein [Sagittula sp. S175]|uniref:TadE/TadG family type IV pilus assembly protein n=1 Tax=Sagittula sp. S175 TaxID=3415129 RepID=UPI003C7E5727